MKRIFYLIIILLFVATQSIAQNSWTSLSGPLGGTINSMQYVSTGNKLYVLNQGIIYLSTNDGAEWARFSPSGLSYIHAFLVDGNKIFIGLYSELRFSEDGGNTWTRLGNGGQFEAPFKMFRLPQGGTLVMTDNLGVLISNNEGVTWSRIYDTVNEWGAHIEKFIDFTSTGDLYISDRRKGIYRHTFPGTGQSWSAANWTQVFARQNFSQSFDESLSVAIAPTGKVIITFRNVAGNYLMQSSANGNSGSFTNYPGVPANANFAYPVWSKISNKLYLTVSGNSSLVYEIIDGATPIWSTRGNVNLTFHNYGLNSTVWKNINEGFAGTNEDGVFYTNNAGISWTKANGTATKGITTVHADQIIAATGGRVLHITQGNPNGYWHSTDEGISWLWVAPKIGDENLSLVSNVISLSDNSLLVSTHNKIIRSVDGLSWTQQSASFTFDRLVRIGNDVIGIRTGQTNNIFRSTNNGVTWTEVTTTGLPVNLSYHSKSEHKVFADATGVIYLSTYNNDVGNRQIWKLTPSGSDYIASQISPPINLQNYPFCTGLFVLNNVLYISDNQTIAYSANQGSTWNTINTSNRFVLPIFQGANGIAISNEGSMSITQDQGKSWKNVELASSHPFMVITDLITNPANANEFIAATLNGPALKYSGNLVVPVNELPPFIDFNWQALNGPYGGDLEQLYLSSNNTLFALGMYKGVFRYNAINSRWDALTVPGDPHGFFTGGGTDKLYYTDFANLYTSSNNGASFTTVSTNQFIDAQGIFRDASGNVYITSRNGVYRSTNDGVTFSKIPSLQSGYFNQMIQVNSGALLTVRVDGATKTILRSTDNGASWIESISGLDNSNINHINISNLESGVIAAVTSKDIYRSTDGGVSWNSMKGNLASSNYDHHYSKVYVSPSNEYFFVFNDGIFVSANQGSTWTRKGDSYAITSMIWLGSKIFASRTWSDGAMLESTNQGESFTIANQGITSINFSEESLTKINSKLYVGSHEVQVSSNEGDTWSRENSIAAHSFLKLNNGDIIAYSGQIYVSSDNGESWNAKTGGQYEYTYKRKLTTGDGNTFYAVMDDNIGQRLFTSNDLINWTAVQATGLPVAGTFNVISLAADASGALYFSLWNGPNPEVYRVAFGTATKITQVNNPRNVLYRNGKVFILDHSGKIFQSTDGLTWTSSSVAYGGESLFITENGYYFISTYDAKLWLSRDGGVNWQNVSNTAVSKRFSSIIVDASNGRAYGAINGRVTFKSGNLIIPNDGVAPTHEALSPPNNEVDVVRDGLSLSITFSKNLIADPNNKFLRIFNLSSPATAVETINVTSGIKNGNTITFNLANPLSYGVTYFVTIDAGAFADLFGNTFAGISSNSTWRFTIQNEPDTHAPTFTFTTSNRVQGSQTTFNPTAQDNRLINVATARMFYRGISSANNQPFQSTALNISSGGGTGNVSFTVNVQDSWYDNMGLEYYFEVEDNSGNKGRSPQTENTYHYSYISFPSTGSPLQIPNSALGFGGTATSYKIFAIPHTLTDNQINTIFNSLGAPDKSRYRITTYVGGANPWSEYGTITGIRNITRGVGYWINIKDATTINIDNAQTPAFNRTNFDKITLRPGWNQIGNPYTVAISWNETREAAENSNIGPLKQYANGTYSNINVLNPYQGGFVYLHGNATIDLVVRFQGITTGGGRFDNYEHVGLGGNEWMVPLQLTMGDFISELPGFGMHPNSSSGLDNRDDINVPSFAGIKSIEINFTDVHESLSINKSMVAPQESYTWDFETRVTDAELTTLSWPADLGESNKELYLFDRAQQRLIDMRAVSSYQFNPAVSMKFRIFYGSNLDINPERIHISHPYPNPLSSSDLKIHVSLPEMKSSSMLSLQLYDQLGRPVTTLTKVVSEKGFHEINWDLSNVELKSGIYIYQINGVNNDNFFSIKGKIIIKH